jgi:hypothetical protein
MEPAIHRLLLRSQELEDALAALLPDPLPLANPSKRVELAVASCAVSIEHALAARAAFGLEASTSAAALLRLQFEALLRAAWCFYAAPEGQLERLSQALDQQSESGAKNVAGMADMLEAVVKKTPHGLSVPLEHFHASSRHALNSFVHTGIHALHRSRHGFPTELAEQLVRVSNGLLHLAYRLLATLTGSQILMDNITHAWAAFADCVPPIARSQTSKHPA